MIEPMRFFLSVYCRDQSVPTARYSDFKYSTSSFC